MSVRRVLPAGAPDAQDDRAAQLARAPRAAIQLAERTAAWLRPLVARAAAIINGDTEAEATLAPQAAIDRLMKR